MSDDNLEVEAWRMLAHRMHGERDIAIDGREWAEGESHAALKKLREAEADLATLRSQNEFLLKERSKAIAYARRLARERIGDADIVTDVLRDFACDVVKGKHLEKGSVK